MPGSYKGVQPILPPKENGSALQWQTAILLQTSENGWKRLLLEDTFVILWPRFCRPWAHRGCQISSYAIIIRSSYSHLAKNVTAALQWLLHHTVSVVTLMVLQPRQFARPINNSDIVSSAEPLSNKVTNTSGASSTLSHAGSIGR